ncbi:hypothetical protein STCU_10338 [Strigomonas culicis]|uniref:Uncharacterized protein n=1 Tax=Strigomonas culicis TaxID=28005 RepID=S9UTK8_9TRYP|nr:hypothetical protein STCU_10338 [Strigomonas culicis]|eukprot:EPY17891.1 hypothetical protein STCU_10338 [Strigomonas culicis]
MWSADFKTLHAVGAFEMVFLGPSSYETELEKKFGLNTAAPEKKKHASTARTTKLNAYCVFADAYGLQLAAVKRIMIENRRRLSAFDELESAATAWRNVMRNRPIRTP